MPIYEYQSSDPAKACAKCAARFEVIGRAGAAPVTACPACGAPVQRVVSRCRALLASDDATGDRVGRTITEYERQGKWSHAAEMAEKQSGKTQDESMRNRALDNYKKAGYDTATLDKHAGKTVDKH